jgi:hypothetical protein
MKQALSTALVAALGLPLVAAVALAQAPQQGPPHVGCVYPAGGRQGTTFQVKVGGRFLDGAGDIIVSGRGVRAGVVGIDKPIPAQQLTVMRDRAQELAKKASDPAVRKELQELRMQIGDSVRRNQNPVLSEIVTLEVTIAPDAEPGPRRLRLMTTLGLTNPLVFMVGQLPEFAEKESKQGKADAELEITLPATVNGRLIPGDVDRAQAPGRQLNQYAPGDVDRYRFKAAKGTDLVAAVSARELMPYLADAVPGWVQATLTLYDGQGRELAYDDDFGFRPDPVLHCRIPADGEYVVEIKDALYRGREDFVYRISIGELPFVTSAFPLGGRARSRTPVEVTGWNLPTTTLEMDVGDAGVSPLTVRRGSVVSNRLPFDVDTLPETVEREPNDSPAAARRLGPPVIVNGRIQAPGDRDVYSFTGRAGEQVVAEVVARRLGSPLDSALELTDASGRRLAFNDDYQDKAAGEVTHQADSLVTATLPANGTYFLTVADTQRKGGPEYGYRLRVGPPRPDFELRVAPSAVNAPAGTSVPVSVWAIRRDGFAGDIVLNLRDAPGGLMLSGNVVPGGQEQVRFTVTAPTKAEAEPFTVAVEGRAVIAGRTVTHRAVPAEDMMQAFAYRHLVPSDELRVAVLSRGGVRVPAAVTSPQPVRVAPGRPARVRVSLPPGYRAFENVEFELSEPPDGIALKGLSVGFGVAEFLLEADESKIRPGFRGNLIVVVSGERQPPANAKAPAPRRRLPMGTLPAISIEVIAPPR